MGVWWRWPPSDYNLTAFAEISAVCTRPEFRGRGYAQALTTFLAAQILAAGKIPFLHVKSENGAKVVYQKIGFQLVTTAVERFWLRAAMIL
jgi:predicted GNAT family acetyltransferase